ncbi:MAG: C-GCAxxG-C-C family (seleno)protein [Rikenellaceae bacterium]
MKKLTEQEIKAIRARAEKFYQDGEFFCSEAVLTTVLDGFNVEYPEGVVAMASGFAGGVGGAKCMCGAISGGSMALSYLFGRNKPGDPRILNAMEKSKVLYDKFIERNKLACCKVLIRKFEYGSCEHRNQCARFTGEMAEDTARIINEHLENLENLEKGGADEQN